MLRSAHAGAKDWRCAVQGLPRAAKGCQGLLRAAKACEGCFACPRVKLPNAGHPPSEGVRRVGVGGETGRGRARGRARGREVGPKETVRIVYISPRMTPCARF